MPRGTSGHTPLMDTSGVLTRIGVLLVLMFMGLCVSAFLMQVLEKGGASRYITILTTSGVQGILSFCVPAYVLGYLVSTSSLRWLGLQRVPSLSSTVWMVIIFVVALPSLNQLIYWNEHISLPFADSLRAMEQAAARSSQTLLEGDSVEHLVGNILVVGCITGFAEEVFFRGALQTTLLAPLGRHGAVWVAAIVFSTMHMQFFGFVPRMMLGAFFGYLYLWSGSLWLSASAHALNNSLVVATAWLSARYGLASDAAMWGVTTDGVPLQFIIHTVATVALIALWRVGNRRKKADHG